MTASGENPATASASAGLLQAGYCREWAQSRDSFRRKTLLQLACLLGQRSFHVLQRWARARFSWTHRHWDLPVWGWMCQDVAHGQGPGPKPIWRTEGAWPGQQPCPRPCPASWFSFLSRTKGSPSLKPGTSPSTAGSSLWNCLPLLCVPQGLKGSCPIR